jgi:hypothetical protein
VQASSQRRKQAQAHQVCSVSQRNRTAQHNVGSQKTGRLLVFDSKDPTAVTVGLDFLPHFLRYHVNGGLHPKNAVQKAIEGMRDPGALGGVTLYDNLGKIPEVHRFNTFQPNSYFGPNLHPLVCCGIPAHLALASSTSPIVKVVCQAGQDEVKRKRANSREDPSSRNQHVHYQHAYDDRLLPFLDRYALARPVSYGNNTYDLPLPPAGVWIRGTQTEAAVQIKGHGKCWIWVESEQLKVSPREGQSS